MSEKEAELEEQGKEQSTKETEGSKEEQTITEPTLSKEEELELQVKELNEKHLRLYSEFENFRRRTAKEKLELISNAGEKVLKKMIPVLDDFERAIVSNQKVEDLQALKEGFDLLHQKTLSILTAQGLKEMEAKEQAFDAELHEAITKIPAPSENLKGKIVDVIEKGYYLNEKIIRHAKVVIGE